MSALTQRRRVITAYAAVLLMVSGLLTSCSSDSTGTPASTSGTSVEGSGSSERKGGTTGTHSANPELEDKFVAWVTERTPEIIEVVDTQCSAFSNGRAVCHLEADIGDKDWDGSPLYGYMFCLVFETPFTGSCHHVSWLEN